MYHTKIISIGIAVFLGCVGLSNDGPELADDQSPAETIEQLCEEEVQQQQPFPNGVRYSSRQTIDSNDQQPLSDGPPLARVYQYLLHLRQLHSELLSTGETKQAKKLERLLAELERRFRYPVPAPLSTAPRVHAIGVYQSYESPVKVRVTDASGPVILVLTSYNLATWQVEADEGVQIDFIVCSGYKRQSVANTPKGVPVFTYCYDDRSHDFAYAYGPERSEWDKMESWIKKLTGGHAITTITGNYYALKETYILGPENNDCRIQMLDQDIHQQ